MSRLIIACSMIEDEVNFVLHESQIQVPVRWIDRGLHEFPQQFRQILQRAIDESDADEILLTQGLCGNAIVGVGSERATGCARVPRLCPYAAEHLRRKGPAAEQPLPLFYRRLVSL